MDIGTTKNLGGVGALLLFIGVIPPVMAYTFFLIPLIGLILLLIGAKGLADNYQEGGIFNNALYGVVLTIVGVVAFFAVVIYAVFNLLGDLSTTLGINAFSATDWSSFTNIDWTTFASGISGNLLSFLGAFVIALVVAFIFSVVAAIFYRKSMGLSAKKTGVGLFGSAGMVLLIGAVLTIILIGFLLLWISLLLIAVAFFQIKVQPTQTATPPPPM